MKIITLLLLLTFCSTQAQVGIGTPVPDSTLDVVAANPTGVTINVDGLLIPRVTRERAQSMIGTLTSTLVYINEVITGTALGTTLNVTSTGFYFFNGILWEKLTTGLTNNWALTGNSGTTAGTNYLGTNDTQNLQLRTGSTERLTIDGTTGNVAIGTSVLPVTTRLEVNSGALNDAIYGHSNNVGGILGREVNFSFGTPSQTLLGAGLYASNPTAGYTSIFGQSTGSATVAANVNYSNVWIGNYNYVDNASSISNPPACYNQLNVTNSALGGFQSALRGYNSRGTTTANPGFTVGVYGTADSQNQDSFGMFGQSFSNSGIRVGGYFEAYNYTGTNTAYAYVGGTINGATARKIIGTGSVSEIIPTENHGRVTLTCPESTEYWYQDYGTVQMIDGKATIILDPILADIIVVDDENPIRVICTPFGMPYFNGVTIMSQTKNSVELLELNGGTHSGKLQFQLVVKPKTNYGEGRFPQAPGPAYLKADKEPLEAKAANQPNDGRKIFTWSPDHVVYKYNPEDYVQIGDVISGGPNSGKIKLADGKYGTSIAAEKPKSKN